MAFENTKETRFVKTKVVTVDDLRKAAPILRGEIAQEIRKTGVREIGAQAKAKNVISSMKVDGRRVASSTGPQGGGIPPNTAKQIARDNPTNKLQIFYQGTAETLVDAITYIWNRIEAETPKASGKAFRSFYFRGYTKANRFTGKMDFAQAIKWVKEQTDPFTSVRIEGPTTAYRRKLIYVYANKEQRVERLKRRGTISKGRITILDERYEFGGRYRLIRPRKNSRSKARFEPFSYRAYLKTIAKYTKYKYKDLWIGYRFVPAYPKGALQPWGEFLPQIYVGLKPVRGTYRQNPFLSR
jgi:hypothetical protein